MSSRISPSAPWLLYVVTAAVFALYVFGAIVSFAGLYGIAAWLILPPYLYWSFPLAVDLAILIYKVAEVILRNDDRKVHKVKKAIFGSIIFTAISSAGNIIHVIGANDPDPLRYWGGLLFAGLMPWAVYLAASVLTDLIVDPLPAQGAVMERELEKAIREVPHVDPDRFTKTQNIIKPEERPVPDVDNEYPPINFYEGEEWDGPVEKIGMNAPFPDLSVTRDVKLEPFPETWGKKDGS